ncbi:uncharacterized protein LOC120067654 [Benincasa hispida]|uniref:uncharacterized protein LOC120067654 n=1 Tax=Benincasa hispida TaxID=102211 RepID=UPI001901CCEC|nr:uncharacterized protein LOC120067654 [Benincasa hispida]
MEFAYNNIYQSTIGMSPFEALYGKSFRSPVCWDEVGERRLLGPELVQTTNKAIQKIRARMQTAQSRQKSYVDIRRKDLEFETGVKSVLKDGTHEGKYVADPSHVVDYEPLQLNDNLSYEEKPIEILARKVKTLHRRELL